MFQGYAVKPQKDLGQWTDRFPDLTAAPLSAGTCLNTLTGHTEWVTKVRRLTDADVALAEGGEAGGGLEDGRL